MIAVMDLTIFLIDVLIVTFFLMLGVLLARMQAYEFDYQAEADWIQRKRRESLDASAFRRLLDPFVRILARPIRRMGLPNHKARIRHLQVLAGHPYGYDESEFIAYALLVGLVVGVGTFLLFLAGGSVAILVPLFALLVTYSMVSFNLRSLADQRRIQIDRQIPYFLDLVTLTMGAGATFRQAAESITTSSVRGPLEEEVVLMLNEVQAGTPLVDALQNMTMRTDSEELHGMVQAIRQGEELGTPLVQVFEEQAAMNRFRRSKKGEQIAARLPNRLAIPNVLLMLSVLILLFGPIIVRAVRGELM